MKNTMTLGVVVVVGICAWIGFAGHKEMRRCGGSLVSRPCTDPKTSHLQDLRHRAVRVLRHAPPELRARIESRWTGSVDELVHLGPAHQRTAAVSTHKTHIRVCLGNDKGAVDRQAAMYVLLHELAHVGCNSTGHTEEFWNVFQHLLRAAEKAGEWQATSHDESSTVCGVPVGPVPFAQK